MKDLTGRIVVITGGSSGIGAAAARQLAARGAEIVLVGRTPSKLAKVSRRLGGATAVQVDFTALDDVRRAGAEIVGRYPTIDVLANNAGLLVGLRHTTVDGFERTIQVNHLAPFLLTSLLWPSLRAAADARGHARVITTSSLAEAAGSVDPGDLNSTGLLYSRWGVYAGSKQANILFTVEAGRRWAGTGVVATCFHPGLVRSRFGEASLSFMLGKLVMLSPSLGAKGMVHLATHDDGIRRPGEFFFWRWPVPCSPRSRDPILAAALWEASAAAVGAPAGTEPR